MAKIIVGVTIVEFCKVGTQIEGGGGHWSYRIVHTRVAFHVGAWFQGFPFQSFKNTYLFNIIMTGCLLGINNRIILCLVLRNLQLMFDSLWLFFHWDVLEPFSNYYLVMLNLLLEFLMKTLYNELVMTLPIGFWIFSIYLSVALH